MAAARVLGWEVEQLAAGLVALLPPVPSALFLTARRPATCQQACVRDQAAVRVAGMAVVTVGAGVLELAAVVEAAVGTAGSSCR